MNKCPYLLSTTTLLAATPLDLLDLWPLPLAAAASSGATLVNPDVSGPPPGASGSLGLEPEVLELQPMTTKKKDVATSYSSAVAITVFNNTKKWFFFTY